MRIVTAREQAEMSMPWRSAATYYHRTTQPLGKTDQQYPHTYLYTADDPHGVGYETRAYGDHVYQVDLDDSLVEPDPNPQRSPGNGEKWWRTAPENVGEMKHIYDPTAPFGAPR